MSAPEVVIREDPSREVVIEQGPFAAGRVPAPLIAVVALSMALVTVALFARVPLEMALIFLVLLVLGNALAVVVYARVFRGRFQIALAPGRLRVTTGPLPTRTVELDPSTIRLLRFGRAIKVDMLGQMTDRVPIEALDAGGGARVLVHCYGHHRARQVADELVRRLGERGHTVTVAGHP